MLCGAPEAAKKVMSDLSIVLQYWHGFLCPAMKEQNNDKNARAARLKKQMDN